VSGADTVREELEKAASLVGTARRLLDTGTTVDLSALEGKVRAICAQLPGLEREQGRALVPAMESLIDDLDRLAELIRGHSRFLAGQAGGG
jgi:hypothetical protein